MYIIIADASIITIHQDICASSIFIPLSFLALHDPFTASTIQDHRKEFLESTHLLLQIAQTFVQLDIFHHSITCFLLAELIQSLHHIFYTSNIPLSSMLKARLTKSHALMSRTSFNVFQYQSCWIERIALFNVLGMRYYHAWVVIDTYA